MNIYHLTYQTVLQDVCKSIHRVHENHDPDFWIEHATTLMR